MVAYLIKFLDALNVRSNDSFLVLEHSYVSVDLYIGELLIVEVSEGSWHLVLTFVIEEDVIGMCIIINFELGSHWLLKSPKKSTNYDHIIHWLPIKLTDVVRPGLRLEDHF